MKLLPLIVTTFLYTAITGWLILRPAWLKKHVKKTIARRSLVVVLATIGACLWIVLAAQLWTDRRSPEAVTPSPTGPTVWDNYTGRTKFAPKSGQVTYRFVKPLTKDQAASGRIPIITPEVLPERLILLNDEVMKKLKDEGNIKGTEQVFYLDYFDDESVADGYFIKQSDPKTDASIKKQLRQHYIGTMAYNQKYGIRFLAYVPTGKIIRRY